jgi:hypothetical protein
VTFLPLPKARPSFALPKILRSQRSRRHLQGGILLRQHQDPGKPLVVAPLPQIPHHQVGELDELPSTLDGSSTSVYSLAHHQLHKMEAREKCVAMGITQEREKFKAKVTYLASECRSYRLRGGRVVIPSSKGRTATLPTVRSALHRHDQRSPRVNRRCSPSI